MGMISALPGGKVLPDCPTGVTRLIDTGTFVVAPPLVTLTVPVFAPGGRLPGVAVTVRLTVPDAGTLPDDGVTVRYGLSVFAVNVASSAVLPLAFSRTATGTSTGAVVPKGTTASVPRAVVGGADCTTMVTMSESGPVAPEHCCAWTR